MPQSTLDPPALKDLLLFTADRLIAAEPLLSAADRELGDGDHGLGMARGFAAAKTRLQAEPPESIAKLFMTTGTAMLNTMGGASGALFGTLFRGGGKAIEGCAVLDTHALASFLEAALAGVVARGGARPGDKTMVDALHPAAVKARERVEHPLPEALEAVAEAAQSGAEATKNMRAAVGRAKALGAASLGHPDPGALSVALILRAASDFVSGSDQTGAAL
jgi:dihydroxyacetone kinase phosphoprotein-dependent L subunit